MTNSLFKNPFTHDLSLQRYPVIKNNKLQAFDSADSLILKDCFKRDLSGKRILIINDQFGAISCALQKFNITSYTDSYLSYAAILKNSKQEVTAINDLDKFQGIYDFILIKIPKNLSFFEDILSHLTHHMSQKTQCIFGGMIKHMPKGAFDLIEKIIGKTSTSLGEKKARLIYASFELPIIQSKFPIFLNIQEWGPPLTNHSNLFSREKLDIGTRFFLQSIPTGNFDKILDLGCANGIIGLYAQLKNPSSQIIYTDESAMAIKSAKENHRSQFNSKAIFHWTHGYTEGPSNEIDLVLCNPPFHQGHTIENIIALQMFHDSYRALKKGGTLRIIGNSHLKYKALLNKIFNLVQVIATNQKFIILECQK